MKFLLAFLMIQSASASPEPVVDATQKSVEALIRPLMADSSSERPQGTEKFRVDSCEKHKINWMNVLLRKEDARLTFSFREGCDVDGVIEPKFLEVFGANLNLRNLQNFTRIETTNTVSAILQTRPVLKLEMRQGRLKGPQANVSFEADYSVRMNPTETKVLSENLGGELRILEINGKKVSLKRKILVR